MRITVGKNEPIEKALRKFKRQCDKAGILKESKSRRYYEKPSDARRNELRKAERNRRKDRRKAEGYGKHNRNNPLNWMFTLPKLSDE